MTVGPKLCSVPPEDTRTAASDNDPGQFDSIDRQPGAVTGYENATHSSQANGKTCNQNDNLTSLDQDSRTPAHPESLTEPRARNER